jgi:hypothetical protein
MPRDNQGFVPDPETVLAIQRALEMKERYDGDVPGTSSVAHVGDSELSAAEAGDGAADLDSD